MNPRLAQLIGLILVIISAVGAPGSSRICHWALVDIEGN
jgi:hypothetical protein